MPNLTPTDIYDKTSLYEKEVKPLVKALMLKCIACRLPVFVSVAVKNDDEGTKYANNVVLGTTQVRLQDNRFSGLLLRMNGFRGQKLPDDVDAALCTICDYLSSVQETAQTNSKAAGVILKDDVFPELCEIAGGGARPDV